MFSAKIKKTGLLKNFLVANSQNKLFAQVTGKRRRDVGLEVPVKYIHAGIQGMNLKKNK